MSQMMTKAMQDQKTTEWQTVRFDNCADLVRDTISAEKFSGELYIGLEHIAQERLTLLGVGHSSSVESAKARFKKGDVLYGKLRPYFRKVVQAPFDGVCSTDIWVLRAKEGIDSKYLFYLVAQPDFTEMANRSSEGTRMPRANWDFMGRQLFKIPDLEAQRSIASILGSLDDKIESNRQMNETLEQMAQALFKSWFVDFDPVRAKAEGRDTRLPKEIADLFPDSFEDSVLGEIPKGWSVKSLDQVAIFLNGLALQKYPPAGNLALPVIKISQLRSGDTSNADRASDKIPSQFIIKDGDVLFSWSGSLEVDIWTGGSGALNQHLFKITSDTFPKWFYFYWTKFHLQNFREIAAYKATTMGHIQRHHLHDAKVLIPPNKICALMQDIFSPLLERQINNRTESKSLIAIRNALLQKLLSGEIRIK